MKDTKGHHHAPLLLPFGALMIGAHSPKPAPDPIFDVAIVGGSFAGVSAAMQLARGRRRVLLIDAGRPRNRFAAHSHGFLGQDGQPPSVIIGSARDQVLAYPTARYFHGEALDARPGHDGFELDLSDGRSVTAQRLILATGVRDELPEIAGIQPRWGASVFHCPYCDGFEVADRQLAVIANHAMSAHQAILIADWGPVTYFTQGRFEPSEAERALMQARGVTVVHTPVVELLGAGATTQAVRLADGEVVTIDAVFTAPKTHLVSGLARSLGCGLDDGPMGPLIRVDDLKQTTVTGVFAAGDAAAAMSNATFASAAGVMAGVAAHRSLIFNPS